MAAADPNRKVVLRTYPTGWVDVVRYNDKYKTVVFLTYKPEEAKESELPF
jgi:hypothetical protein